MHRALGVEDREGGERLDGGAGRDDVRVEPVARGRLGRDLGGHQPVGVGGEDDDGGGAGAADGVEQLGGRRPAAGAEVDGDRAGLPEQRGDARPGGTGDDTERDDLLAGGDLARQVGDPHALGAAGDDARLHGGPGVVDVHVDVPEVRPADDEEGVAEPVPRAAGRVRTASASLSARRYITSKAGPSLAASSSVGPGSVSVRRAACHSVPSRSGPVVSRPSSVAVQRHG